MAAREHRRLRSNRLPSPKNSFLGSD